MVGGDAGAGVRGLFVGLGAQFARDIPFYAFFFGTYELTLRLMRKHTTAPQEVRPTDSRAAARPDRRESAVI